jgi:hypothetical protein
MIIEYKGKRPEISPSAFIAPSAVIIGDVTVGDEASIWWGAVLRSEDSGPGAVPGRVLRRPDLKLIEAGLPFPIHPFYVRLAEQVPPQDGDLPAIVAPPEPTQGPHLGYAVQWFLFAATAVGAYAALLSRDLRRRERSA